MPWQDGPSYDYYEHTQNVIEYYRKKSEFDFITEEEKERDDDT